MLTVAEARARILEHFEPLPAEVIALQHARGRVLAEDVIAGENLPPFANSSMDGYAVRAVDTAGAAQAHPSALPVRGDVPAGSVIPPPLAAGTAVRIMTGAPVPEGADAVVPVEETDDAHGKGRPADRGSPAPPEVIRIFKAAAPGANVRPAGQDVRAGQVVMTAGAVLRPAAIGVLAALGRAHLNVHRPPRVAILSTGDELCRVDETPRPGQIRDTNSYTLTALAEQYGARVLYLGIARDRLEDVLEKLRTAVTRGADLILSSAGVSVGAYDVVKHAVETEGALDFWRVRMRPGKPLAFGQVSGIPFIGLPGNPVSAMVGFEVFVRPALLKLGGQRHWEKPTVQAALTTAMRSDGRESYVRVTLEHQGDGYHAHLTGDQGSNIITSLVKADGLMIVPEGMTEVPAGSTLPVWLLNAA
jgi:molybdopterin molybdotransferase